ncbi:hypothetical protein HKBW3S47_01508, partial [Candidatus Hakubella thermalkaliphila]
GEVGDEFLKLEFLDSLFRNKMDRMQPLFGPVLSAKVWLTEFGTGSNDKQ